MRIVITNPRTEEVRDSDGSFGIILPWCPPVMMQANLQVLDFGDFRFGPYQHRSKLKVSRWRRRFILLDNATIWSVSSGV